MRKKLLTCTALLLLSACAGLDERTETATDIAKTASLQPLSLSAPPFVLSGWARIGQPDAPIHLYIEGDGLAWMSKNEPSLNPTPTKPLGLQLAALDPASNVVYLARPCQFTALDAPGNNCDRSYWMGKRFAPEVIASYDEALTQISARYHSASFDLFGYSGGANIAALLAERRSDISSLRTIAGNLDNDAFTAIHSVSAMPDSLNARTEAAKVAQLPQIHFIGAQDKVVSATLAESFKATAGGSACIAIEPVQAVTHDTGWQDVWPELLQMKLPCTP